MASRCQRAEPQQPAPAGAVRRTAARGRGRGLFDREILGRATVDAFKKLDPAGAGQEPGHVRGPDRHDRDPRRVDRPPGRLRLVASPPGCSLTVLFANFAEALAEGRGKAQADTLRKMRSETERPPAVGDGRRLEERSPPPSWPRATSWSCEAGDMIPRDGEIIEGVASVDESAITGESAPVIREAGGDRSAVTGGTKVLSDRIVVRITAERGPVLPRPDDRPGRGGQPAEDAQRDRPDDPAGRADHHLPAGRGHPAAVRPRSPARHGLGRRSWSRCWSA